MDPDRLSWATVGLLWLVVAAVLRRSRPTATLGGLVGLTWLLSAAVGTGVLWHRGPLIHLLVAGGSWWPRSRVARAVVIGGYALSASSIAWPIVEVAVVAAAGLLVAGLTERSVRPVSLLRRREWQAAMVLTAVALAVPPALAWAGLGASWASVVLGAYSAAVAVVSLLLVAAARPWSRPWATDLVVELGPASSSQPWDELVPRLGDPKLVEAELEEATMASTRLRARLDERQSELRRTLSETRESWRRLEESDAAARRLLAGHIQTLTAHRLGRVTTELRRVAGETTGESRGAAGRAVRHLVQAREELVALGEGLSPPELAHGLVTALHRLAVSSPLPVEVEFDAAGSEDLARLPAETAASVFYVAVEAVTNAVKHAKAERITVSLTCRGEDLELIVRDDGVGGSMTFGHGLEGIHDRVLEAGGRVEVSSPWPGGTALRAVFPLHPVRT